MQDMAPKRVRPPEGSGSAIREASQATQRPRTPTKRVYTVEYKERVLRELAELRVSGDRGAVGALFRREGLHWPTVLRWEKDADAGGLEPKKRGRKLLRDAGSTEVERLRKQVAKLETNLRKAEIIIDVQKKLGSLLGLEMPEDPESATDNPATKGERQQ